MTDLEKEQLSEIHDLLVEAYGHALAIDGHCKSGEGIVEVTYSYPTYWELAEGKRHPKMTVMVYSYVLGPSRQHYFKSMKEALETVRKWHAAAMTWTE